MMRLAGKLGRLVKNQGVSLTPPVLVRRPSTERVQPLTDPGIETLSEVLDPIALAQHLGDVSRAPGTGRRSKKSKFASSGIMPANAARWKLACEPKRAAFYDRQGLPSRLP